VPQVAHTLIYRFVDRGRVNYVEEFAVGLPTTIIAYALGVSDHDLATFKRWADDMVMPVGNQSPSRDQVRGYLERHRDFAAYFTNKIADRQRQPADDVVSDVANAEIEGDRLDLREQLSIISQLLTAGNEASSRGERSVRSSARSSTCFWIFSGIAFQRGRGTGFLSLSPSKPSSTSWFRDWRQGGHRQQRSDRIVIKKGIARRLHDDGRANQVA